DYDRAIADFDEVLRHDPQETEALGNRGLARFAKRDFDLALADFNEQLRLEPNNADAFDNRGHVLAAKNQYHKAITDFNEAIRIDAEGGRFHKDLDYYLASCPDAKHRDGVQAIEHAQKACEFVKWRKSSYVSVLGTAYAEVGNFEEAKKYQQQAIDLETN